MQQYESIFGTLTVNLMLSFKYHVSLQRFEITHSALEAVKIFSTMAHAYYNALIVTFSQGHHNMNCQ